MNSRKELLKFFILEIIYFKDTFLKTMNESVYFNFNYCDYEEDTMDKAKQIVFAQIAKDKKIKISEIKEVNLTDEEWEEISDEKYLIQSDLMYKVDSNRYHMSLKNYLYSSIDIYTLRDKLNNIQQNYKNLKEYGINTLLIENDFRDLEKYFEKFLTLIEDIFYNDEAIDFIESSYIESFKFEENKKKEIDFSFNISKDNIFNIFNSLETYLLRIIDEVE